MLWGCVLPTGNALEFDLIKDQLIKLDVVYSTETHSNGSIRIIFEETEIAKLPTDSEGPYMPVDDGSGHDIYPVGSPKWRFESTLAGMCT